MQYKDLQLDKIQAFAPVPKQIDKQNYKDMAEALLNLGARGADAYASYKINQIPMGKERDLALAEYQLLRHQDPSALQRIEERRYDDYWRDRQENVQREMLEQSRAEAEAELKKEDEKKRRDAEITYDEIMKVRSALNAELTKAMKDYNSANRSTTKYINIYDPETRRSFLNEQEQGIVLLNKFNENKTQEKRLGYVPKDVNVDEGDILDSVKVKDVDEGDILDSVKVNEGDNLQETDSKSGGTEKKSENENNDISGMLFNNADERIWYLKDEKVPLSSLSDDQIKQFTEHIKKNYAFHGEKIISDKLGEKEKEKLEKQFGYKFITEAEKNEEIKKQNALAQEAKLEREKKAFEELKIQFAWQGSLEASLKWMEENLSPEDYSNYKKAIENKLGN